MTLESGQLGFNSILNHWLICFNIQDQNKGYELTCPNIHLPCYLLEYVKALD